MTEESGKVVPPEEASTLTLPLKKKSSLKESLKKPGRPKKHGQQPIWMLVRATLVVYGYDKARAGGEKHADAVAHAARLVRATDPELKISEREVRRVLADWRSRENATGLLVTKPDPANCTLALPNGKIVRQLLIASYGPRPVYPRANAAAKAGEEVKSTTN